MDLTLNDYLTFSRTEYGIKRPALEGHIKFEFWGLCLDELKQCTFWGNKDEDAHEHLRNINNIVDLFQAPGVTRNDVMMMAFPFTLKGRARYWLRRLPADKITTWELLRKAFLKEYRTPGMIMRQIDALRRFQQGSNEQLYVAWERFVDELLKCPEHKFNKLEQIQIFYNGLNLDTRRMLDAQEPIPKMTACKGMERIEEMARHSAMWHEDEKSPTEFDSSFKKFECEVRSLTEQVKMVEHHFNNRFEGRVSNIEKVIKKLLIRSDNKHRDNERIIWEFKNRYDKRLEDHATTIKRLEDQVGRLAQLIRKRDPGELPSTTETNPKDLANAITTRSGLNYKEPAFPLDTEKSAPDKERTTQEVGNQETVQIKEKFNPTVHLFPSREE